jgi:hypothetical protein
VECAASSSTTMTGMNLHTLKIYHQPDDAGVNYSVRMGGIAISP